MVSLETVAIGAGLLLVLYWYLKSNHGYWKKRGVRFEPPSVIFGNLFDSVVMKRNQGQIVAELYRKFKTEKVAGMFNFGYPALIVRDPELVYRVFVTDFNHFADNDIDVDETVDKIFARNMFAQKGERWKRTRQQLSPAFTIAKLKPVFDGMCKVGEKLKDYVSQRPGELRLKDVWALYSSEVVASCCLGIDGHSFTSQDPPLLKMGKLIFEPSFSNGLTILITFVAPTFAKLFKIPLVPKAVPDFFDGIIRNVIKHREASGERRNDMVQYWIDLKEKSKDIIENNRTSDVINRVFTDEDILGGCITFFIEGFETSSMTSANLLYQLAMNQDIQDKVKAEIDQVYAAGQGKLTIEAVAEMPYLSNCILETIRIHPGLLNSTKRCTKRYEMDIGKSEPLIVEPGTSIMIPTLGLHMDPLYWPDPEKFDPDRHKEDKKTEKVRGSFIPFGEGPRICIGMRMAMIMVKVAFLSVLRDYKIVPSDKTPTIFKQDPQHFMSCHKGGLYAKFIRRN